MDFHFCKAKSFELDQISRPFTYLRFVLDEEWQDCLRCLQINQIEFYGQTVELREETDASNLIMQKEEPVSVIQKEEHKSVTPKEELVSVTPKEELVSVTPKEEHKSVIQKEKPEETGEEETVSIIGKFKRSE